jgi:hypothetical protein
MNTRWFAVFLVLAIAVGCKGVVKATDDTLPDTTPDVADEDMSADVPAEGEPDVVPDGEEDVMDVVEEEEDAPTDAPEDTIGMPCTTDEECDMGVFCDGVEYCHTTGVCRRSPAPTCDDSDDCTVDSCDATLDACVNTLIDGDGDLHPPESCGGDDCDDAVATVYTGAPEVCGDGTDQDCDGRDNLDGECACAVDITSSGTFTGTTTGASNYNGGSCRNSGGAPEIVHELVLGSATEMMFDLSAPDWEGILYVRDGACDGTELGCVRDRSSGLILSLAAGTYYVFVDGYNGSEDGAFTLSTETCPASTVAVTGNNQCSGAHAITANGTYTGDTTSFSDDADPPSGCARSGTAHDAWFSLTLSSDTTVRLDTRCSEFDTVLYIRSGTCTGTGVACDDDTGIGPMAVIDMTLTAGTYYIILDGYYDGSNGEYRLTVSGL